MATNIQYLIEQTVDSTLLECQLLIGFIKKRIKTININNIRDKTHKSLLNIKVLIFVFLISCFPTLSSNAVTVPLLH